MESSSALVWSKIDFLFSVKAASLANKATEKSHKKVPLTVLDRTFSIGPKWASAKNTFSRFLITRNSDFHILTTTKISVFFNHLIIEDRQNLWIRYTTKTTMFCEPGLPVDPTKFSPIMNSVAEGPDLLEIAGAAEQVLFSLKFPHSWWFFSSHSFSYCRKPSTKA